MISGSPIFNWAAQKGKEKEQYYDCVNLLFLNVKSHMADISPLITPQNGVISLETINFI